MKTTVGQKEIEKIITANHHDPFQVLGIHQITVDDRRGITIRAFLPEAVDGAARQSYYQQKIFYTWVCCGNRKSFKKTKNFLSPPYFSFLLKKSPANPSTASGRNALMVIP